MTEYRTIRQIAIMPATNGTGFDTFLVGNDHDVFGSSHYPNGEALLQAISQMLDRVKLEVPA